MIEIDDPASISNLSEVRVGDILRFAGTGGHVLEGACILEMIGAFSLTCLGDNGQVLTPLGPPNAVLFRVHSAGIAKIDVVTGDPWGHFQRTTIEITVDA